MNTHCLGFYNLTIPLEMKQYLNRILILDRLIKIKGTGNPSLLAKKLNVSESTLYTILAFMKEQGAPIGYCKFRQSYYYEYDGGFNMTFIPVDAKHLS